MSTPPKTSGWAIAALVFAILCLPVGLVLGIVALVKINNSQGQMGGKGLAIAAIVISGVMIPMTGILAAIAIPNFIKFQNLSKQSEAKMNLSQLRNAQEMKQLDLGRYIAGPASAGTVGRQRTTYAVDDCKAGCGPEDPTACDSLACLEFSPPPATYFRYACNTSGDGQHFACAALGDLDGDGDLSLMVVGSGEGPLGAPVPDFGGTAPACPGAVGGELFDCTPGEF